MNYLSEEIAALAKYKSGKNLIKNEVSCGIFQDTGRPLTTHKTKNSQDKM